MEGQWDIHKLADPKLSSRRQSFASHYARLNISGFRFDSYCISQYRMAKKSCNIGLTIVSQLKGADEKRSVDCGFLVVESLGLGDPA